MKNLTESQKNMIVGIFPNGKDAKVSDIIADSGAWDRIQVFTEFGRALKASLQESQTRADGIIRTDADIAAAVRK